jgi:hypothetical protein
LLAINCTHSTTTSSQTITLLSRKQIQRTLGVHIEAIFIQSIPGLTVLFLEAVPSEVIPGLKVQLPRPAHTGLAELKVPPTKAILLEVLFHLDNLSNLLKQFLLKPFLDTMSISHPQLLLRTEHSEEKSGQPIRLSLLKQFQSDSLLTNEAHNLIDLISNFHELTKDHLAQSFLRVTFDVIYSISKTYSYSCTYPQTARTVPFWIAGPAPLRANAHSGQSWPQLFAYQAQKCTPCAHFGFRSINKYMHTYYGNIPENICHSCQCYLGHWEFDHCPKKFLSQQIKLSNGMLVHHITCCHRHTSI